MITGMDLKVALDTFRAGMAEDWIQFCAGNQTHL